MEKKVVRTGLVQMTCVADKQANIRKAVTLARDAAGKGAQIICLPELFRSLYFCQREEYANFALAEPIPGPSTETLGQLAAELGVVIIASLFERRAPGLYHNTAAVLDADGRACAPGETGRVVVTDLHNFATPLVRSANWRASECGKGRRTSKSSAL